MPFVAFGNGELRLLWLAIRNKLLLARAEIQGQLFWEVPFLFLPECTAAKSHRTERKDVKQHYFGFQNRDLE